MPVFITFSHLETSVCHVGLSTLLSINKSACEALALLGIQCWLHAEFSLSLNNTGKDRERERENRYRGQKSCNLTEEPHTPREPKTTQDDAS